MCHGCGKTIRGGPKPTTPPAPSVPDRKRVTCFDCSAEVDIETGLPSAKCHQCGASLDLRDYRVYDVGSKHIKTKGAFIVEPRGYLFDSEAIVGEAIIRGKFHGKLVAERSLTVYTSTEIQGSFSTAHFVLPPAHRFRWKEPIAVNSAEIAGELTADLRAAGTIVLKATARVFGSVEAKSLVVEEGAVVVGPARVGNPGLPEIVQNSQSSGSTDKK